LTGRVQLLGCQVEQALSPARGLEQEREQTGLRIADDTEDLSNLLIGKRSPPAFLSLRLADGLGRVVLQVTIGDRDVEQTPRATRAAVQEVLLGCLTMATFCAG
jgi:hypothetical protein